MNTNDAIVCLVLGETGVGKSSFINSITKQKACKVSEDEKGFKACTTKFKNVSTMYDNSLYYFIDTPGLNDAKGDEKNINEIKTGLSEFPKFRCILILLKLQDKRLKDTDIKNLKIFMTCFPTKKFWEHVFIVRTNADINSRNFNKEKKKVENAIIKSINDKDFEDFKNFMVNKKIELPNKLEEFYVDNGDEEPEDNYMYNKEQIIKIFNKIKATPTMFKNVTKVDKEVVETNGLKFPVKQVWRTIKFFDHDNNVISTSPYISYEDEVADCEIVRIYKRKTVIDTESDCGDVKIKYDYYETKIYNIDGREVSGKECYKGSGWE